MNRIILIGNGFDLAHGMKTGYHDFLRDVWNNLVKEIHDYLKSMTPDPNVTFRNQLVDVQGVKRFGFEYTFDQNKSGFDLFSHFIRRYGFGHEIKNAFLHLITSKQNIDTWVDIENEYYNELLRIVRENSAHLPLINKLNMEFKGIQSLLERYLERQLLKFNAEFDDTELRKAVNRKIYSPFQFKDFTEESVNKRVEIEYEEYVKSQNKIYTSDRLLKRERKLIEYLKPVAYDSKKKALRKTLTSKRAAEFFDLNPENLLFLNFNYTSLDTLYESSIEYEISTEENKETNVQVIRIHGNLNRNDNPIIFGYGDEIDESYKEIEKLNINSLLDNVKSIRYLETANYKDLLEYLNSDEFQVFIFGHSCGISDRTLLNTIFEHQNCVSIKPFYHQIDDEHDNYSDLVRNISRNFNDNVLMRSKVVNKTYCEPLT